MITGQRVSTNSPQPRASNIIGIWMLLLLVVGCGAALWMLASPPDSFPLVVAAVQPAEEIQQESPFSSFKASPTVVDLDGDGELEIIMVNVNAFAPNDTNHETPLRNQVQVYDLEKNLLWARGTNILAGDQFGGIEAAPSVADIDGDGDLEIVAGATDGYLYAWHHDGQPVTNWPIRVSQSTEEHETYRIVAQPAIGDIDNDGKPDIVVPLTDGKLYAFDPENRTLKLNFPIQIGESEEYIEQGGEYILIPSQPLNSSPRIVDLDQDGGFNDLVFGSTFDVLYIYQFSPAYETEIVPYVRASFYPPDKPDDFVSTPFVADIDPDIAGLEIAIGCNNGRVYLIDKDGNNLWEEEPAASTTNTRSVVYSSPFAGDMDGDGDLEVVIGSRDNKFWAWHHDGTPLNTWQEPVEDDFPIEASPALGDINDDGSPEVVVGSTINKFYAYTAEGNIVDKWPKDTYGKVIGRPVLKNVDSDTALEVIAGDLQGQIYIVNQEDPQDIPTLTPTQPMGATATPIDATPTLTTTSEVTQTATPQTATPQTATPQTATPQTATPQTATPQPQGTPTPTPTVDPGNTEFIVRGTTEPDPNNPTVDTGAPGSTFILDAKNYTPNTVGEIWVRKPGTGFVMVRTRTFDSEGTLSFSLYFPEDTPNPSSYDVKLRGEPDPSKVMLNALADRVVTLRIRDSSDVKNPEGPSADVSEGNRWDMSSIFGLYLPLVKR